MNSTEVMKLFDSCWFEKQILKKQSNLTTSSNFEANPGHEIQQKPSKTEISIIPTHHNRSMSDQLSSKTSFFPGSLSPDSVLATPHLQTILSGKEITEENPITEVVQDTPKKSTKITSRREKKKEGKSKSLSDLEFEELKGFMDLGFVFSEEDKDSGLAEIIPGLHRLGKKNGEEEREFEERQVSRPYLSEAWRDLDRKRKETKTPLLKWKLPELGNEIDMKDNLRWWAYTVASAVR